MEIGRITLPTFGAGMVVLGMLFLTVVPISSCDQNDSGPHNRNTLTNKIFIIGSQIDDQDNLVLYVNGTDADGEPLNEYDLQRATVNVTTASDSTTYLNGDSQLSIRAVSLDAASNDRILSLSLLADYSGSIDDASLNTVGNVFTTILNYLPPVYEAQIINFSDTYHVEMAWTEAATNLNRIVAATYRDDTIKRNGTALYDSIGFALLGDPQIVGTATTQGDGLVERCRPARMMVVFSDGRENPQPNSPNVYKDAGELTQMIEDSQTVVIMLGAGNADLSSLRTFAGKQGAVVRMETYDKVKDEISNWAQSLSHMVKFTLTADSQYQGNTVTIKLGGQEVVVLPPSEQFCRVAG